MEQNLYHTVAILSHTPAVLNILLRDLTGPWVSGNEGENTWSPVDVLGHLIHGERTDWMPRVKTILQWGTTRTFEIFDREGFAGPAELATRLNEFARLRSENLAELSALNLTPAQFELRGRHPAFGEVTLDQLLATWAVHDLTHLNQIGLQILIGLLQHDLGVFHFSQNRVEHSPEQVS